MSLAETTFLWHDIDSAPIEPPTASRLQDLPFGKLTWENFERLCYRLAHRGRNVEDARLYGVKGQGQEGIDLYVRRVSGEYETWQCKRYEEFKPAHLKKAVETFLAGEWVQQTKEFRLAVASPLTETEFADEIELQRKRCEAKSITLLVLDAGLLSLELKQHPDLVDDFFGRPWVAEFNGNEAALALSGRKLTREERLLACRYLADLYGSHIELADPGIPAGAPAFREAVKRVSIADRYVEATVELIESVVERTADPAAGETGQTKPHQAAAFRRRDIRSKMPLSTALSANERFLLTGGPGFGKSAAMRVLALDLMSNQARFPELAKAWRGRLPLLLPFSFLTCHFRDVDEPSIERCLNAWLRELGAKAAVLQLLTEMTADDRLFLLVDGLDEWQSQDAAIAALTSLMNFIQSRRLPLLATSRPAGFNRISEFGPEWKRATLLPLDSGQQRQIVTQWLRHFHGTQRDSGGDALEMAVERDAVAFTSDLTGDPGLAELGSVPLLLSVLIYLRLTGRVLPQSRLEALEELVDALILDQPKRRAQSALNRDDQTVLRSKNVRRGLAFLAYTIHGEPDSSGLSEEQASEKLRIFFENELQLPSRDAETWTERVMELGRHEFGVLVATQEKHVGFMHRLFQEFLAAQHVARFTLEVTEKFCLERGRQRAWQEVTILLLQMLNRTEDVDKLLEAVRGATDDPLDGPARELLLTRLAVAPINCSRGRARELIAEAFTWIEQGMWLPLRIGLVREIVDGLESEHVRDLVAARTKRWFPGRVRYYHNLPKQIAKKPSETTANDLLIALHNADSAFDIRQIAEGLALCGPTTSSILEELLSIVRGPGEAELVAGALHAIVVGWPDCAALVELLQEGSSSASEVVRVVSILSRFNRGDRSLTVRDALASFCREGIRLWPWEDDVVKALAAGWPKDPTLREGAFHALRQIWPKRWREKSALQYLLLSGSGDDDVARMVAEQLGLSESDFGAHAIFQENEGLLAGFAGHPIVVPAAEAWLQRNGRVNYRPNEVAVVARLAGTPSARQYLIEWLKRGDPMPAWIISTLSEMGPPDAQDFKEALEEYLADRMRRNSSARWLHLVIGDKHRLGGVLREILAEGDLWGWHDALGVLVELEGRDAPGLWASVEDRLRKDSQGHYWRLTYNLLIKIWPEQPLIRHMVRENIYADDVSPSSLFEVYGEDPEIRPLLEAIVLTLHSDLRLELVRALEPMARRRVAGALAAVAAYAFEPKPEAQTVAARAYAAGCGSSSQHAATLVRNLDEGLNRWRFIHHEQQQGAIAGLLELGRADLVAAAREDGKPLRLTTYGTHGHNWEFIESLIQHWPELIAASSDVWERFGNSAAVAAELVKAGKRELAAVQTTGYENSLRDGKVLEDDEVRALIALHGRSSFLRDLFLLRLRRFTPLGPETSLRTMEMRTYHAMGKYIAENFSGDPIVHDAVAEITKSALVHDIGWIALCRGWPNSPLLEAIASRLPELIDGTEPITAWVLATKADSALMAKYLLRYPHKIREAHFGDPREGLPAIWARLESDERCRQMTFEGLRDGDKPDIIVSLLRLLGPSMRSDLTFSEWVRNKLRALRSGNESFAPGAFDPLSNQYTSIEFALLQAMLTRQAP